MFSRCVWFALLLLILPALAQERRAGPHGFDYDVALPGRPFGIAITEDGAWVFAALVNDDGTGGIALVRRSGSEYGFDHAVGLAEGATGLGLTHDGNLLVAAAGAAVYFLDASTVASGGDLKLIGSFSDGANAGSICASITPDDRWLFVCDENLAQVTLVDLNRARTTGFTRESVVGTIRVGTAPTETVFSPDGVWAYTTVEYAAARLAWPKACIAEGQTADQTLVNPQGALAVLNVAAATSNPGGIAAGGNSVAAGCSPVRPSVSPDGLTVYVTARNNNEVLALDTRKFTADPLNAIIGRAPVGAAPVPVAWVDSGALLVVGNSNRFQQPGIPQSLTVVNAEKLRAGGGPGAVVRTIRAGAFPRTLKLSPDGRTLFLANFDSKTLQVMNAAVLGAGSRGAASR